MSPLHASPPPSPLSHNWYQSAAPAVDFPVDQLDIKKKVKPKLGEKFALRLRFSDVGAGGKGPSVGTGEGYEMVAVPTSEDDDVVLGAESNSATAAASGTTPVAAKTGGSDAELDSSTGGYKSVPREEEEEEGGSSPSKVAVEMTTSLADVKTIPGSRLDARQRRQQQSGADSVRDAEMESASSVDIAGSTGGVHGTTVCSEDMERGGGGSSVPGWAAGGSGRYSNVPSTADEAEV